jgi:dienelactone hydrolase
MVPFAAAQPLLPGATPDRGEMMWDYFAQQYKLADEARMKKLAAVRTKDQVDALRQKVLRGMQAGIGAFPDRTPLNARTVGEIVKNDYVIEKVLFESQPGYYVPANVYRPKSTAQRRAAVVHPCGHYDEAKAKDDYQKACIGLAKKGIVTLIFDPMGQGERPMYRRPGEKRVAQGEHQIPGRQALLIGQTMANSMIWDAIRAIDYLETRPDVEKTRIGMLGHSGGGTLTLFTAPIEPRLRASMSCCAVSSFYHKMIKQEGGDAEQVIQGAFAAGIDHPELIAATAPRAFLIGATLRDHTPLEGVRRTYDETRHIFEILGHSDRIGKTESDNIHMLDKNLREACCAWMLKHLAGETADTTEPEMEVETPERLWCTKTGTVTDLPGAKSTFDLNRASAQRLVEKRRTPGREDIQAVLACAPQPEQGIELPQTLARGAAHADTLLIVCAEAGRNSEYAREVARGLVAAGYSVLGVDLRGWGETTPKSPKRDKRSPWEEFLSFRGVELGRPLLGMRVADLLNTARKLSADFRRIYLAGIEGGGVVAAHAAAIEPSIAGVAVHRSLQSYRTIMESPLYEEPPSSLAWGALTRYDLPDLARLVAPRPYVAIDPRDAKRRLISGGKGLPAPEAVQEFLSGLGLA